MAAVIPDDVREFIARYITRLDQLEILLLVSALPYREWTVAAVDTVVRSRPAVAKEMLESLVTAGMLVKVGEPPVYRYGPRTAELDHAVSALAAAYRLSQHRIVELIYSKRRPSDSLTDFSDAFRFRKKD